MDYVFTSYGNGLSKFPEKPNSTEAILKYTWILLYISMNRQRTDYIMVYSMDLSTILFQMVLSVCILLEFAFDTYYKIDQNCA